VRALTELLDAQFGTSGVHVATVTVCGPVAPGTAFDPDRIAEHYWQLHTQPAGTWDREVVSRGESEPISSTPTAACTARRLSRDRRGVPDTGTWQ
jgi:hypothetical protein